MKTTFEMQITEVNHELLASLFAPPVYDIKFGNGHTSRGTARPAEDGMTFDGHLTCGPHDADGNHIERKEQA